MAECRGGDGLIKLFGKTIPVPEPVGALSKDLGHSGSSSTESGVQEITTDPSPQPEVVDAEDPAVDKGSQLQSGDDEAASEKEKLKKPDKILPCPRCSSMDTKFCYFNNYNVNQPRHFCKACHRYWTAGGALRNVPVGAGRRKNRPLGPNVGANHHHHHRAPPAAGFNLAFPNAAASSPNSPSPVYTDGHWQAGPDRRF